MKKHLYIFIVCLFPLYAFAWGEKGIKYNEGGGSNLPATEFYNSFDTTTCHYLTEDNFRMPRPTELVLTWDKNCDYIHPFDGKLTSKFGKRRRRMHYGVDIDLETGDQVKVTFEGMVRYAKYNSSYGNLVVVRHPNGLETYYAHLSQIDVKAGDYIQAGDIVGLGGNTGRSYGAHLHFEIRFLGKPIDPSQLIDFDNKKLRYDHVMLKNNKDRMIIENASKFHQVSPGDDLYSISKMYCVPVQEICRMNNLTPYSQLLIDTKIRYN
jgi:hypothetical protein